MGMLRRALSRKKLDEKKEEETTPPSSPSVAGELEETLTRGKFLEDFLEETFTGGGTLKKKPTKELFEREDVGDSSGDEEEQEPKVVVAIVKKKKKKRDKLAVPGTLVDVAFTIRGERIYYPATIVQKNEDDTYKLDLTEGGSVESAKKEDLRLQPVVHSSKSSSTLASSSAQDDDASSPKEELKEEEPVATPKTPRKKKKKKNGEVLVVEHNEEDGSTTTTPLTTSGEATPPRTTTSPPSPPPPPKLPHTQKITPQKQPRVISVSAAEQRREEAETPEEAARRRKLERAASKADMTPEEFRKRSKLEKAKTWAATSRKRVYRSMPQHLAAIAKYISRLPYHGRGYVDPPALLAARAHVKRDDHKPPTHDAPTQREPSAKPHHRSKKTFTRPGTT